MTELVRAEWTPLPCVKGASSSQTHSPGVVTEDFLVTVSQMEQDLESHKPSRRN